MTAALVCERCGDPLESSYRTTVYSGVGQSMQFGPDGTGAVFPLGGFVACSWNCLAVLAAQRAGAGADAAVRIVAERERQITTEGYSPEHDNSHEPGELALAGACYAIHVVEQDDNDAGAGTRLCWEVNEHRLWPWDDEWWKPKNRDRDLIRAGALIAAELDRDPARRRPDTGEAF